MIHADDCQGWMLAIPALLATTGGAPGALVEGRNWKYKHTIVKRGITMSEYRRLDAWTYSQQCFKVLEAYRTGHITANEQQEEFALLRVMFGLQSIEPLYIEQQESQPPQT